MSCLINLPDKKIKSNRESLNNRFIKFRNFTNPNFCMKSGNAENEFEVNLRN